MTAPDPCEYRSIGTRDVRVTRLGLGCAPLGNLYHAVDDETARATVDVAWESGMRLFDTAPLYGHGLSERRIGDALRDRPRDEYVLSTKVGRVLVPDGSADGNSIFVATPPVRPVFDFTGDGIRRSIAESLDRLGIDRIDIVHVHDPDDHLDQAIREAFPALIALRDEGVIRAVGCGMNVTEPLSRIVECVDVDVVLLAGRYTLLDQTGAIDLLPRCVERGVGVIIGGVFNSGLLADPADDATYDYEPASAELVVRARVLRSICEDFGVSLTAAAIGFAVRHEAVTSVVVGARSPAEIHDDVAAASTDLPDELWDALLDHPDLNEAR